LESVRRDQVGISRQGSDIYYLFIVCWTPGRPALLVFDISDREAFQIDGVSDRSLEKDAPLETSGAPAGFIATPTGCRLVQSDAGLGRHQSRGSRRR
jgi:hypothetical protein